MQKIMMVGAVALTMAPLAANARRNVNPAPQPEQYLVVLSTPQSASHFSPGRAGERPTFQGDNSPDGANEYALVDSAPSNVASK